MVYFLEELSKRTEFSVLQKLTECATVSAENLACTGNLIVPGFAYKKLSADTNARINAWLETVSNHLILVPSWTETDLTEFLDLPVPVAVVKYEPLYYESVAVSYVIETGVKDKFFIHEDKVLGVSLRKNTGTGLISVLTIPVLDYKQSAHFATFKAILSELFQKNPLKTPEVKGDNRQFLPTDIHLHLLILFEAGIDFEKNLSDKMRQYFAYELSEGELKKKANELQAFNIISGNTISDIGKKLIEDHKLRSFIKVVKKQEERGNEW